MTMNLKAKIKAKQFKAKVNKKVCVHLHHTRGATSSSQHLQLSSLRPPSDEPGRGAPGGGRSVRGAGAWRPAPHDRAPQLSKGRPRARRLRRPHNLTSFGAQFPAMSATEELSGILSRRQEINEKLEEGLEVKPQYRFVNVYTEFHEFSRKEIKQYEATFNK
ncbi:unnamed protein product [Plutella xylostella]|uniref:(diamondback moth) hypothetical protein n=1 Tax=Plutella xylostella TaxID=51655 RepID=A0A8S4FPH4_PLUXY|nr:unnamed protein product [Plutella xylostella]